MPSSVSTTLLFLGFVIVLAGFATAGVAVAIIGALFEFYLFYKTGSA